MSNLDRFFKELNHPRISRVYGDSCVPCGNAWALKQPKYYRVIARIGGRGVSCPLPVPAGILPSDLAGKGRIATFSVDGTCLDCRDRGPRETWEHWEAPIWTPNRYGEEVTMPLALWDEREEKWEAPPVDIHLHLDSRMTMYGLQWIITAYVEMELGNYNFRYAGVHETLERPDLWGVMEALNQLCFTLDAEQFDSHPGYQQAAWVSDCYVVAGKAYGMVKKVLKSRRIDPDLPWTWHPTNKGLLAKAKVAKLAL